MVVKGTIFPFQRIREKEFPVQLRLKSLGPSQHNARSKTPNLHPTLPKHPINLAWSRSQAGDGYAPSPRKVKCDAGPKDENPIPPSPWAFMFSI